MAGYTRQSTFADGDTITAALFNNEYNQLVNAFSNTSGHAHDGTAGEGPVIALIGDAGETTPLNKVLIDTVNNYIEFYVDVSSSSVQQLYIADGAIVPVTDNDIDLGTSSLEFKDLYIDGTANLDSLVLGSGSTVTAILDEDDLSSDSATSLATQQSIKAYVDAQVTAQDLDFQGDSGGALSIDLDSESLTIAGGTGIDTSGATNTLTVAIDSTVATLTGSQTLTNKTLDVDNNTVSNIEVDNFKASAIVLESEGIGSNDNDTTLPTSAAVKDYVDTQLTAEDLDFQGDTGGALSIDLDSETLTIAGGTGIDTSGATNTLTVAIDSTVATLTGTQTLTNKTIDAASNTLSNIANSSLTNSSVSYGGVSVSLGGSDATPAFNLSDATAYPGDSSLVTVGALNSGSITSGFGAIDNGSSAITTTGTITYGSLSDGVITITAFADEDDMVSNSATLVPTQQSVKAYVDSQVTAQDLDLTTDSGTIAIDLDSETLTVAGGTGIDTSASANSVTVAIDSTVATLTDTQTLTNKTLTSPDINTPDIDGGTIDGTVIGGATPAAADFTTMDTTGNASVGGDLSVTGDLTINGTTTTVNSTTVTVDDPIFTLGGDTAPVADDNKDRGIEFRWHNGTAAKVGFFGYDDSASVFTFIPDATNTSEVFSGSAGDVAFGNIAGTLTTAAQPNITSLGTLTGLITTGSLTIGTEDNNSAILEISGAATGSAEGGELRLDTAADYDGTYEFYRIDVAEDDFRIGRQGQTDFTLFSDGTAQFHGNLTATLATAAQPNVTSVGTLSSLTVSGDLTVDTDTLFVDASEDAVGIGGVGNLNQTLNVFGTPNDTIDETTGTVKFETTGGNGLLFGTQSSSPFRSYIQSAYVLDTSVAQYDLLLNPLGGNVGIGITNPAHPLQVRRAGGAGSLGISIDNVGTTDRVAQYFAIQDDATGNGAGHAFYSRAAGSTTDTLTLMIDENQRVGIGTDSPAQKLHISSTGNTFARIDGGATSTTGVTFDNGDGAVYYDANSNFMRLDTNGAERMRIDSLGNVGIGTTNPAQKLDVQGIAKIQNSGADSVLQIFAPSDSYNPHIHFGVSGVRNSGVLGYENGDDALRYRSGASSMTTGTERFCIESGGNVGIGTTSPDFSLDILGTYGTTDAGLCIHNNSSAAVDNVALISFNTNNTFNGTDVQDITIGAVKTNAGNRESAFVVNSCSGTGSPEERMRIAADGSIYYATGGGDGYSFSASGSVADVANMFCPTAYTLAFGTNGSERMRIDSSGNVLIGTTSVPGASQAGRLFSWSTPGYSASSRNSTAAATHIEFYNPNGSVGTINTSGSATQYNTSSDARLKEITGEARGLEVINALNPVAYNWKADGQSDEGLIAQEVEEIVPNAVSQNEEEYYQMDYSKLVVHLVKGMKEQQEQIESLKSEIELLKGGN